ncbi:hypothetical protein M902_2997 [Bacteriovorax sp. BAL6_X]|uniref:hypothetical protein n=1 Tax=Bacteriovorax sp. BAL6_X TaxID=1201290 RepID=UPI0003859E3E|nr:hypothetical protein [Bacteriovorax sp. BAL6_X]EPZ51152.1 hypothetical protein M902_2997 [Bacteriovorax sp. BAL6_X]
MKHLVLILCAVFSLSSFAKLQTASVEIDRFDTEEQAKKACLDAEVEYDEIKDVKVDGIDFEFVTRKKGSGYLCEIRTTLDSYEQVLSKKKIKQKITNNYDKSYTECMKMRNRIINTTIGYVFGDVDFYKKGMFGGGKYVCEFNFIVVE